MLLSIRLFLWCGGFFFKVRRFGENRRSGRFSTWIYGSGGRVTL
jgi:hypothetical protein